MKLLTAIVVFLLLGCGSGRAPDPLGPPPEVKPIAPDPLSPDLPKKVILAVWGAAWCHVCHSELPKVEDELRRLRPELRDAIDFRVYVPTGRNSNESPNDAETIRFKDELRLSATPYSDPKWKMFRYALPKSNPALPAGAVLSPDLKVLKAFYPGQLSASEIVWAAQEAIK